MKKIIVVTALLFSTCMFASEQERTMGISVSPLQLGLMSLDGKYAIQVHDRIAVTVPFTVQYFPSNPITKEVMYFAAGGGAQFYLLDSAFKSGLYIETRAIAGYSRFTPSKNFSSFSAAFIKGTALFAYGWVLESGFSLNLGVGAYYNHAFGDEPRAANKVLSGLGSEGFSIGMLPSAQGLVSGFGPTAEFSLGYSW